jgi:T4 RnlA family RNA ligase
MSLEIQRYLRFVGTPEDLTKQYSIKSNASVVNPSLYLFKYDQINSPMNEAICQECRGIILDKDNNWEVVARPYSKFFNYGEPLAHELDWAGGVRVQEKLDGSLMIVYNYKGIWYVASSGNPDAAGQVNAWPMSFAQLFWKTWDDMNLLVDFLDPRMTYMFELTSPYNMVVVPHTYAKLTLIGIRHTLTGQEYDPHSMIEFFTVVHEHDLSTFEHVLASFDKLEGQRFEGYVIVDKNYNRVKVKHPQYVALHHMKDSVGASPKRLVEIIRKNESEEFLVYFPEFSERFHTYKEKYTRLVFTMEQEYAAVKGTQGLTWNDRKSFAAIAKTCANPAYMFQRLDGSTTDAKHFLAEMQIDQLMRVLEAM